MGTYEGNRDGEREGDGVGKVDDGIAEGAKVGGFEDGMTDGDSVGGSEKSVCSQISPKQLRRQREPTVAHWPVPLIT